MSYKSLYPCTGSKNAPEGVIVVYAEWCPHCKYMEDAFVKTGLASKNVKFVALEESKHPKLIEEIRKQVDVRGYPTILLNVNKKMVLAEGPRDAKNFKRLAQKAAKMMVSKK